MLTDINKTKIYLMFNNQNFLIFVTSCQIKNNHSAFAAPLFTTDEHNLEKTSTCQKLGYKTSSPI